MELIYRSIQLVYLSIKLVYLSIELVYRSIELIYHSIELFYHCIKLVYWLLVWSELIQLLIVFSSANHRFKVPPQDLFTSPYIKYYDKLLLQSIYLNSQYVYRGGGAIEFEF